MPLYLGNQKVVPAIYTATDIDFPVAVELGGTGATDVATARENLGITPANIGAATAFTVYCEVPYDGWTDGSSLGYYVDITDGNVDYGNGNPSYTSLSGVILSTDVPVVDVKLVTTYTDNEAYLAAWACVQRVEARAGAIRVYVGDAVPEVAFNIIVKVVR